MSLVVTAAELGRENGILFLSILQKKKEMEKKDQDRGGKKRKTSDLPDSNQRPKDFFCTHYSPPLYQLS
jgi:hypothetical protein